MQKSVSIIAFTFILLIILPTVSECKELKLLIITKDVEVINEVYEGETFLVYVTDKDEPYLPLDNYTLIFNGKSYHFGEIDLNDPSCYLTAPQVDSDKVMQIVVKKEGYSDAYAEIKVKNRAKLFIYPASSFSVKSGDDIIVQIKDEKGNPVKDVNVKLEVDGKEMFSQTDSSGIATLKAPDVDAKTVAYIEVSKEGYESAKIDGFISPPQESLLDKIGNKNFFVVLGIAFSLILFFAGTIRYIQRKDEFQEEHVERFTDEEKHVEPQKELIKADEEIKPVSRDKIKIEEIEVRKPERKIFNKGETAKPDVSPVSFKPLKPKAKPDTWVVGGDSIIEKIDKKLGKVEDNKKDLTRWLTGKEDIAAKVDEKLREIEKKKKSNSP